MFNNYSKVEQMQNELQWWEEQRMSAISVNDLKYAMECEQNVKSLLDDIRNEQF